jgi:hypothetical protein
MNEFRNKYKLDPVNRIEETLYKYLKDRLKAWKNKMLNSLIVRSISPYRRRY